MTAPITNGARAAAAAPGEGSRALVWKLSGEPPRLSAGWTSPIDPQWAWGGATGRGVRVLIIDSGVEAGHPGVGEIQGSYAVARDQDGVCQVVPEEPIDTCGHGTACAGVVRSIAPECEIHSVRALTGGYTGTTDALLEALRWAVGQGFQVINLSLSTTRRQVQEALRELADEAYFRGTLIVASAHNQPLESFPWRFSSVLSVGSHAEPDRDLILYNPAPPVEFFAHGQDVDVAWSGGTRIRASGNSFAAPHVAGRCALLLSRHPDLTPFQVKCVLHLTAANPRDPRQEAGR